MLCPYCQSRTKVTNSRSHNNGLGVWRRRRCTRCHAIWTTDEHIELRTSHRVSASSGSHLEPLERDKVLLMVHDSLQHRQDSQEAASGLTDTIISKILALKTAEIERSDLDRLIHETLQAYDSTAAAVYAAKHGTVRV